MKGSAALTAVHGKNYEVNNHDTLTSNIMSVHQTGCIPCMLYIASGSSTDWAHGNGINFTTRLILFICAVSNADHGRRQWNALFSKPGLQIIHSDRS